MGADKFILASVIFVGILFSVTGAHSILKNLEAKKVLFEKIDGNLARDESLLSEDDNVAPVELVAGDLQIPGVMSRNHIVGMKMERHGEDNINYHKEVFLGKDEEKFRNGDYLIKEQRKKLKEIFAAVDIDGDGILSEAELTDWVLTKTREHFYEARMSSQRTAEYIDLNRDNEISWNEFIANFLAENGMNKEEVLADLEAGKKIEISKNLEGSVQNWREKWIRVQEIGKKSMSFSEFFNFQHPETSNEMLKFLVEDILHDMDMDNSNDLTVQEYVAMPPDADVDASRDIFVVERRKEFREVLDKDNSGKVTVEELEAYLDPLSRTMAAQEARQLIGFGDTNEDGKLTLEEVLENSEFFTGSKLYNYALSVHEEF